MQQAYLKGQSGIRSGSDKKWNQISNSLKNPALTLSDSVILYPWIKLYLTCILRLLIYQHLSLCGWLFILCSSVSSQDDLFCMLACPALTSPILAPVFAVLCRCSSAIPSSLLVPLMSGPVLKPVIICYGVSWALAKPRSGINNMANRPKGETEKGCVKIWISVFLVSAKTDERIEKAN